MFVFIDMTLVIKIFRTKIVLIVEVFEGLIV